MKNAKPLIEKKLLEIGVDIFLIPLGFCLAYFVRIGHWNSSDFAFFPYLTLALSITPLIICFLAWSGLYHLEEKKHREILRIVTSGALFGSMFFVLVFFFKREFFFSRSIVLLSWIFISFLLFVVHLYSKYQEKESHKKGKNILRTLIIGNGKTAEKIITTFQENGARFQPVAIIAPYGGGKSEISQIPVPEKFFPLPHSYLDTDSPYLCFLHF